MLGLSIALLVGNPLATWLGQVLEWRHAFGLVALIALLTVAVVARSLPHDPDEPHQDPIRELRDFNRKPVWLALGIGAIGFAGMFCVFSYLAPTMTQVTGLPESRSEEHTSELQSLMRISYAVFCLKKNISNNNYTAT